MPQDLGRFSAPADVLYADQMLRSAAKEFEAFQPVPRVRQKKRYWHQKRRKQGVERTANGQVKRASRAVTTAECYVYFVTMHNQPIVKVGVSNSPAKRASAIQTDVHQKVFVSGLMRYDDRTSALHWERVLHRTLKGAGRGLRGEWFDLRMHEVEGILRVLDDPFLTLLNDDEVTGLLRAALSRVDEGV